MGTTRIPFARSAASSYVSRLHSDNESVLHKRDLHAEIHNASQRDRVQQWSLKAVKAHKLCTTKTMPAFDEAGFDANDDNNDPFADEWCSNASRRPHAHPDPAFNPWVNLFANKTMQERQRETGSEQSSHRSKQSKAHAQYTFEPDSEEDLPLHELKFGTIEPNIVGQRRGSQVVGSEDSSDEDEQEEDAEGSAATAGPSQTRQGLADARSIPPTPRGRHDLYGGKTKKELYSNYHGKSPLGAVDEREPEDHSLQEAVPVTVRDVESQGRPPQLRGRFDGLKVAVGSWFEAKPVHKTWALAGAGLFVPFLFLLLLVLLIAGQLSPAPRTGEPAAE